MLFKVDMSFYEDTNYTAKHDSEFGTEIKSWIKIRCLISHFVAKYVYFPISSQLQKSKNAFKFSWRSEQRPRHWAHDPSLPSVADVWLKERKECVMLRLIKTLSSTYYIPEEPHTRAYLNSFKIVRWILLQKSSREQWSVCSTTGDS